MPTFVVVVLLLLLKAPIDPVPLSVPRNWRDVVPPDDESETSSDAGMSCRCRRGMSGLVRRVAGDLDSAPATL